MASEIAFVKDVLSRLDLGVSPERYTSHLPDASPPQTDFVPSGLPARSGASRVGDGIFMHEVEAAAARERQRQRDLALLAEARLFGWKDVTSETPLAAFSYPSLSSPPDRSGMPMPDALARHSHWPQEYRSAAYPLSGGESSSSAASVGYALYQRLPSAQWATPPPPSSAGAALAPTTSGSAGHAAQASGSVAGSYVESSFLGSGYKAAGWVPPGGCGGSEDTLQPHGVKVRPTASAS